jgi:hypothetical protein
LSIDPWTDKYAWQTPYAYFSNSPIAVIDWKGMGADSTVSKYEATSSFNNETGEVTITGVKTTETEIFGVNSSGEEYSIGKIIETIKSTTVIDSDGEMKSSHTETSYTGGGSGNVWDLSNLNSESSDFSNTPNRIQSIVKMTSKYIIEHGESIQEHFQNYHKRYEEPNVQNMEFVLNIAPRMVDIVFIDGPASLAGWLTGLSTDFTMNPRSRMATSGNEPLKYDLNY